MTSEVKKESALRFAINDARFINNTWVLMV